jgi:hypothetical protein
MALAASLRALAISFTYIESSSICWSLMEAALCDKDDFSPFLIGFQNQRLITVIVELVGGSPMNSTFRH